MSRKRPPSKSHVSQHKTSSSSGSSSGNTADIPFSRMRSAESKSSEIKERYESLCKDWQEANSRQSKEYDELYELQKSLSNEEDAKEVEQYRLLILKKCSRNSWIKKDESSAAETSFTKWSTELEKDEEDYDAEEEADEEGQLTPTKSTAVYDKHKKRVNISGERKGK